MNANDRDHGNDRRNALGRKHDERSDATSNRAQPESIARRSPNRTSRAIAHVMDDLFTVPGTKRRVGLDPIIGLIPGVGDAAGAVATAGLVIDGVRYRVPFIVLLRMAFNTLLDMTVGAVPVLGDAFDFFFRANVRNERLMVKALDDPASTAKSSKRYLIGAVVMVIVLFVLVIALAIGAIWGLISLIQAGF
ncbi:DUF4112 domain-containing protein [uncultured Corynebacterium sp.]|uniref:DUF4112 domain-containing protein n=1 Tax=uncultured Corynebacterium sp. TaxID=159447 RepID=UPI0025FEA6E3|nr:DUF4112 domain-containing protein [uncultured Corynebacterium sp.]